MDKSLLVRILGFPVLLLHGDLLVLDRWRWLRRHLPRRTGKDLLLDVGCGNGAFSIGAARLGYLALGLSWDQRNQQVASDRAHMCHAPGASFEIQDIRFLAERRDLRQKFHVAICLEAIEHVLDDRRLMQAMAECLQPGGRLLLTAPFLNYRAISPSDNGPFSDVEDGWHVRRGYSSAMLIELCQHAGLITEEISYCGGFLSQKMTWAFRLLSRNHPLLVWGLTLPLRLLPPLLDPLLGRLTGWPPFSIGLVAYKPRFSTDKQPHKIKTSRVGI
ncbi:MAG: methyltransferase domain-containing protein [Magnetococcales bacterium]|nr:methyltransferase domain-containing protein [Magnetococcales bacterium]MBF0322169.1 methyltransferase domain-containing protein [Magnetococcales bacterium]